MDADGNRVEVTIQKKEDVSEAQQAQAEAQPCLLYTSRHFHMRTDIVLMVYGNAMEKVEIQDAVLH